MVGNLRVESAPPPLSCHQGGLEEGEEEKKREEAETDRVWRAALEEGRKRKEGRRKKKWKEE